ncbi:MAG TPA: PmeII family type II restriction endonuclease [Candidatus Latescibacteria bacterium]|nr:PmeII family type II restriction endonuclease [Candidatus Latescibacterota bacterium]HOS65972.1 PmeII family type II restriction endonuclease [Candidatus Latescibacterota bacterium]HQK22570.1 PmeII family type II restriction endonuclease [Candidatus Latescibacterota bacterium]
MGSVTQTEIIEFIEPNMVRFHNRRLDSLLSLQLKSILSRKNPYLFKAKNLNTAQDLVQSFLNAHLSSQEEGIFGGFLEELAIFICSRTYGGRKAPAEGIDLGFEKDGLIYLVSIKSGPNWGNSRQVAKMKDDFRKAKRILGTNAAGPAVVAVNGCCYGKDDRPDKGDYLKLCGQRFWEFISGDGNLYTEIIEPLGHKAEEKNRVFLIEYAKIINRFTREFSNEFCAPDGSILWRKLVQYNSGKKAHV